MIYRLAAFVRQQILLRDIGDVVRFLVLGEQMVIRLILGRPHIFRNREPPFLGIVEHRVDIENDAAKREQTMAHDLTNAEPGFADFSVIFHAYVSHTCQRESTR